MNWPAAALVTALLSGCAANDGESTADAERDYAADRERMVRGQLGTDGQRIFVRYPGGGQESAPVTQIIYTRQLIHFGPNTVSIGNRKNQALYEDGEVETYIAPLLKHGRKVGLFRLFVFQLQDGEIGQIYTWLYVVATITAVVFLEFGDKLEALK